MLTLTVTTEEYRLPTLCDSFSESFDPRKGVFFYLNKNKKMKSFNQFCKDANIQELWNPFASTPIAKPKPKEVLAYKNYQSGVLNKDTGKFTQRAHTGAEQKRYGWKPVHVSSYSKADTPGSLTASGHRFDDKQRLVAVPYASKTSSRPSTEFGTKLQMTLAPGTRRPVATTSVQDTGNFGPAGAYNKKTSYDLALQTARDVSGNQNITATNFGKRQVYVRTISTPKK
ncbi:hypothetical protein [Synechococcus phage DSL-LC03]|nr:hypothetical protein [Synechococcus phage DSL-LC03]